MSQPFNDSLFTAVPVIGIARNLSLQVLQTILPLYQKAGFDNIEVTMNTEHAPAIISRLVQQYPGINIGAGTVCDMNDLHTALDAGASFIVTPILNADVIRHCVDNYIPVYPGAYTPLEIYTAHTMGATAVKVFPIFMLGPQYIKEVLGPLNKVKLLPTGGVSASNVQAYFKAGATGVGMGGSLFNKNMIANNDYDSLYQHFLIVASLVKKAMMVEK